MTTPARNGRRLGLIASTGIALVMLLAVMVPAISAATPTTAASPFPANAPASGSSNQWAFGGSVADTYSCSTTACPGGTETVNQTLSMNWNINVHWVVIYTQTNVSATQTEFEGQTALGVSITFGYSVCVTTTSCQVSSISLAVQGHETSTGFTNVTSGSVNLTAGSGSPASVPALAVLNASTKEDFNLSGSLSDLNSTESVSASFDVGGSELSSISFATPLGLVPASPKPGDAWNASEPYTAAGSYVSGLSGSVSVNGTSKSYSSWTPGSVGRAGTLNVSGSDNGTTALQDNYTVPPTSITAQDILLTFSGGNFSASDGWVLASTDWYSGILSGLGGDIDADAQAPASGVHPAASGPTGNLTSSESAYYVPGKGFVGASFVGNASNLTSGLPGGPTVNLEAGPEPVSVAEQQYASITAGPGSGGFPLVLLVVGSAVAAAAIVAVVLIVRHRSVRRRPPATATPAPAPGTTPPSVERGAP